MAATRRQNVGREAKVFKIIIIGDVGVGKTVLCIRFCTGNFPQTSATIGVDFRQKTIYVQGQEIKLQLFDTAGEERHRAMTTSFYRRSHGVIIVYDVTDVKSFKNIPYWMKELEEQGLGDVPKILVGNKCDKDDKRVRTKDAEKLAAHYNIPLFETSVRADGDQSSVEAIFTSLAKNLLDNKPAFEHDEKIREIIKVSEPAASKKPEESSSCWC